MIDREDALAEAQGLREEAYHEARMERRSLRGPEYDEEPPDACVGCGSDDCPNLREDGFAECDDCKRDRELLRAERMQERAL